MVSMMMVVVIIYVVGLGAIIKQISDCGCGWGWGSPASRPFLFLASGHRHKGWVLAE
jgi:hypothetical protein